MLEKKNIPIKVIQSYLLQERKMLQMINTMYDPLQSYRGCIKMPKFFLAQ